MALRVTGNVLRLDYRHRGRLLCYNRPSLPRSLSAIDLNPCKGIQDIELCRLVLYWTGQGQCAANLHRPKWRIASSVKDNELHYGVMSILTKLADDRLLHSPFPPTDNI